jgi:hypothetical protein
MRVDRQAEEVFFMPARLQAAGTSTSHLGVLADLEASRSSAS